MNIYFNGYDWIVADSVENAIKVHDEHSGKKYLEGMGDLEDWRVLGDSELLTIIDGDTMERVTKTADEWIKEVESGNESFFLCSTEF